MGSVTGQSSGADSIRHEEEKGHGGGAPWVKEKQKGTDQTVLSNTKALTKTTNCTCRAKNVEGHNQKKIAALRIEGVPLHFHIRSGATGPK